MTDQLIDTEDLEPIVADEQPIGSLSVLNCGAGDLKFRFDANDPDEVEKAKKVIEDMLKRGYTILVEVDGEWRRATGFDPAKNCYLVTEPPPEQPVAVDPAQTAPPPPPKKRGRPKKREVPAATVRATAVAPTAGG